MNIRNKERLGELRIEECETQVQVAEGVQILEQQYQKYERGASIPGVEILWRLADHFGVTVDYLIGRSDER